jgi:hypothetical protein
MPIVGRDALVIWAARRIASRTMATLPTRSSARDFQ